MYFWTYFGQHVFGHLWITFEALDLYNIILYPQLVFFYSVHIQSNWFQVKASERQQKDDKEGQERLSSELRRKDDEINTTKGELSALQSELNALKEKSKEDLGQFKKEVIDYY